MRFAVSYAVLKLCVEVVLRNYRAAGVLWASGLAGAVDLDAITLAISGIAGRIFDPRVAALAISIGVLANTAAKMGYAVLRGDRMFWRGLAPVLGAAFLAGTVLLVLR